MISASLLIFLHVLAGVTCLASLAFSLSLWRETKNASGEWKLFILGLLCLLLSESLDAFTPILMKTVGIPKIGAQVLQLAGYVIFFRLIAGYFKKKTV